MGTTANRRVAGGEVDRQWEDIHVQKPRTYPFDYRQSIQDAWLS